MVKLLALDAQDLTIISAHVQDSIISHGDIVYEPAQRRFIVPLRRFSWEGAQQSWLTRWFKKDQRHAAILRFDCVDKVASQNLVPQKDALLVLLALEFSADGSGSGGAIDLIFANHARLRLNVECVEVALHDLGPVWPAGRRPKHARK